MEKQFDNAARYGYIISEMNGKKEEMLKEEDYSTLKRCSCVEEMAIKLSRTYKGLAESAPSTKPELKKKLLEELKADLGRYCDVEDRNIRLMLDHYIEFHRIQNFIYILQCKSQDPSLEKSFEKIEIGDFNALRTIKFSKDMMDVKKYCVENSFLKKFGERIKFEREFSENNFQVLQAMFFKLHIEETHRNLGEDMEHMREILMLEGDRQIVEITTNTLGLKDLLGRERMALFPNVCSMDLGTRKLLSCVETYEDMKAVLNEKYNFNAGVFDAFTKRELVKCCESFSMYGDLSCVYSYFKMKEQEIKNILWIAECIIQDRRSAMDHLFVVQ